MSFDPPVFPCPICYSQQKQFAMRCDVCDVPLSPPLESIPLMQFIDIPKKDCPQCFSVVLEPAKVCNKCGTNFVGQAEGLKVDPNVQLWTMCPSYHESWLYGVPAVEIHPATVTQVLNHAGFANQLVQPEKRKRPEVAWEISGLVRHPTGGNPTAFSSEAFGEQVGWTVSIFPTSGAAVAKELTSADQGVHDVLAQSGVLVGVRLDDGDEGFRALAVQLSIIQILTTGSSLDANAGRFLSTGWWPQRLSDGYTVRVEQSDAECWIYTQGLTRWGSPELEFFNVPAAQVDEATAMLHVAADFLVVYTEENMGLPIRNEPFRISSGHWMLWSPYIDTGAGPGHDPTVRKKRFPFGSVTLMPASNPTEWPNR